MALYSKPDTSKLRVLTWFMYFFGDFYFSIFSLLQKPYLRHRFAHVKNWAQRTAIYSQVVKHTCPSEAVGTGPWIELYLSIDKAETQPGGLLKTRQNESAALIISTKHGIVMGGAVLYLLLVFQSALTAELLQLLSLLLSVKLPLVWCIISMFSKDRWLLPVYLLSRGYTLFCALTL